MGTLLQSLHNDHTYSPVDLRKQPPVRSSSYAIDKTSQYFLQVIVCTANPVLTLINTCVQCHCICGIIRPSHWLAFQKLCTKCCTSWLVRGLVLLYSQTAIAAPFIGWLSVNLLWECIPYLWITLQTELSIVQHHFLSPSTGNINFGVDVSVQGPFWYRTDGRSWLGHTSVYTHDQHCTTSRNVTSFAYYTIRTVGNTSVHTSELKALAS